MGVVKGVLNISSNAVSVLRSIKSEQSAFRKDVESTSKSLQKTFDKKWNAKVETAGAAQKLDSLKKKMEPLKKKVTTALAVKDAATSKLKTAADKVKSLGKMVAEPLAKLKDKVSSGVSKISGALKKLGKAVVIPVALAGAALLAGSIGEGAKLEQSIGGVETLFKGDAGVVQANADKAFATAGLSANNYMEQVTSFSASLLQSLGGDTAAAAAKADMAIIDMADNANKFGTDMGSIQDAYQGFAKQNYTMLDNLKLGYGGTKTEMERLLKDANELTGVEYNIDNLADVYGAIHAIQEEMGVTGTTAKEGSETFSGSFAAMKAAASNLMGNLAIGGDVTGAMENLVDSASTFLFNNALPMVGRIFSALPGAIKTGISKAAPMIKETGGVIIQGLKDGMMSMLPSSMADSMQEMFSSLSEAMPALQEMGGSMLASLQSTFGALVPVVTSAVSAISGAMTHIAPVFSGIAQIVSGAISTLAPVVSTVFNGIASKIGTVAQFLGSKMGFLKGAFGSAFSGIASVLTTAWSVISPVIDIAISVFKLLFNVVQAVFPAIKTIVSSVWNFLKPIFEGIGGALSAVAEGVGWLADKVGGWLGLGGDDETESPARGAAAESGSAQVEPSPAGTATGGTQEAGDDRPTGDDDDPINVNIDWDDFDWPDDDGGTPDLGGGGMAIPMVSDDLPAATPAAAMGEPQVVEQHIDQSVTVTLSSLAGSITIKEEVDIDAVAARVVDQVVSAIQNTQAVPTPA